MCESTLGSQYAAATRKMSHSTVSLQKVTELFISKTSALLMSTTFFSIDQVKDATLMLKTQICKASNMSGKSHGANL